jgi:hypothetical protein
VDGSPPASRVLKALLRINLAVILFAVALGLVKTGNPSRYFGEGRFTTGISCLQLLVVAALAFATCTMRRRATGGTAWGACLWILIGAGFVFLAADDALQIHEHIDGLIHKHFHLRQTGLTDRIDDAIVALYGLIGVAVLWLFRNELLRFKAMFPVLAAGFIALGGSIFFDTLSNRDDLLFWVVQNRWLSKTLEGWFAVGDGACELIAEGLFIAAFYVAWQIAHAAARNQTRSKPQAVPGLSERRMRKHPAVADVEK